MKLNKMLSTSFISGLGRHNPRSFGKDIGLEQFKKFGQDPVNNHKNSNNILDNVNKVLKTTGLKTGEHLAVKLIETTINSFLNHSDSTVAMSGINSTQSLGQNNTTIYRTDYHLGHSTTKRVKNQLNTPLVIKNEKVLAADNRDYETTEKRMELITKSGFNQKTYAFLMEDTFLNVRKLVRFYNADPRIKKNILNNTKVIRNIYGCIYKTKLEMTIRSEMDFYSTAIRIHLVKMNEYDDSPRELVSEITTNKTNSLIPNKEFKKDLINDLKKDIKKEVKKGLRNVIKNDAPIEELEIIRDMVNNKRSHRGRRIEFGKLPENAQLTDPDVKNERKKFQISFCTNMETNLNDSVIFQDRAKIVHTWNHVLNPGSEWKFKLTNHFGKGVHLNYLYDIEEINIECPIGHFLVIEHQGDKRACLVRKEDNAKFIGTGPSRLLYTFNHSITYLGKEKEDEDYNTDAIPLVYRINKNDNCFVDNSEFAKYFTPERKESFNTNFEDIILNEHTTKELQENKDYVLEYGTPVVPSSALLETMKQKYENLGGDPKNIDFDSLDFNITNPPAESENKKNKDYEGTEDDEKIDFDNI